MDIQLSDKLVLLRKRIGLTQKIIAERVGKSKATINSYEHGIHTPPLDTLVKLAKIYGVSVDYLLCGDTPKSICIEGLRPEEKQILSEIDRLLIRLFKSIREEGRA